MNSYSNTIYKQLIYINHNLKLVYEPFVPLLDLIFKLIQRVLITNFGTCIEIKVSDGSELSQ